MERFDRKDVAVIRELARKVADLAARDVQQERIRLWKRHNSLKPGRPMILIFPEGSWRELIPAAEDRCACELLRKYERNLRGQIHEQERFDCDNVLMGEILVRKKICSSGWGLEPRWLHGDVKDGAKSFSPVIKEPTDLKKLRKPEITYDEKATMEEFDAIRDAVGDILPVRLKGICHVSFHLMRLYTALRGLEEVMMDMCTEPAMLQDAMSFFEEGHHGIVRQYEAMNLLEINNDNTYHNSGGNGWTEELPPPDFVPGRVRPKDMWASAEAQELTLVSPEMHREFALEHEKRLLAQFALTGYGCCEDLTNKLDDILTIPRIRRISIAPSADVEKCAEKLGGRCIFSWKPQPAHLVGNFDGGMVSKYLKRAVDSCSANGCVLEIILKDTHTCENHPERFEEWSRICCRLCGADS